MERDSTQTALELPPSQEPSDSPPFIPGLRLKKIELHGFKSFADRTAFSFENGVTGIVGPNGCGKSNVADAFRWVMGEQSAKSLRGEKMQDVIFAGTHRRKQSNFAEVVLTFTGATQSLRVPYDEVEISRRLLRSGESEYRLNGQCVRLKDIQALFYDSGIGKDAFAIIEQGKIDEIILRSPEERRAILEQAAGIHGYRQKWREAERKLMHTEANLNRVTDILREVDLQMRTLEKQVVDAQKFKQDKARLALLEAGLFVARWHKGHRLLSKLSDEAQAIKEEALSYQNLCSELAAQGEKAKAAIQEKEIHLQLAKEEVYRLRSATQVRRVEEHSSQKRLEETKGSREKLSQKLEKLQKEISKAQEELEALQVDVAKDQKLLDNKEGEAKEGQIKVQKAQRELALCREAQQNCTKQQMELVQRSHAVNSRLRESQIRLENSQERLDKLKKESERTAQTLEQLLPMIEERKENATALRSQIDQGKELSSSIAVQISAQDQEIKEEQDKLDQLLIQSAEMGAKEKVLLRLKEEMEGLSSATKKILNEAAHPSSPLFGKVKPLFEVICPLSGYESAFAAVMRPYSQTLIVDTDQELAQLCAFAQTHQLSDFSVTTYEFIGRLSSQERAQTCLAECANMGQISSSFLKESYLFEGPLDVAAIKNLPFFDQVNQEGIYIDRRGVLFYPSTSTANHFLREAELKNLAHQIAQLQCHHHDLQLSLKKHLKEKEELISKRSCLDQENRQLEMKLVETHFSLERALKEEEELKQLQQRREEEHSSLMRAQQTLHEEIATLSSEQEKVRKLLEHHQEKTVEAEKSLQEKLSFLQNQNQTQRQLEKNFSEDQDRYQKQLNAIQLSQMRLQDHASLVRRLEEEIESCKGIEKETQANLLHFHSSLEGEELALSQATSHCQQLEEQWKQGKEALLHLEQEESQKRQKRTSLEEKLHQVELTIAQHTTTCQNLETEAQERLQLTLPTTKEEDHPLEETLESTEREVRSLRRSVEKADHINLASIEEFDSCKTRHQFLTGQVGDLERSREELKEIIHQLDAISRQRFSEIFEKIRAQFKHHFSVLFEGGEADLLFIGSEDVLEAGLEITAKPPGKQPRSIKLLSGGEKCLTAMALLFALFEVKPAPFCILDEIDAPLDDTNVSRFLRVLQPFMQQTQFLIITHNKITMSIADVLYGISMEEKGVSKKISIQFERQAAPLS